MYDALRRRAALALTVWSVLVFGSIAPVAAAPAPNAVCRSEAELGKTDRAIAALARRENQLRDDQTDFVLVNGHPKPAIAAELRHVVSDLQRLRSERAALRSRITQQRDTAVSDLRIDYTACETAAN